MKVRYVRISTKEQNTARQDLLMQELGVNGYSRIRSAERIRKGQNWQALILGYTRSSDQV